TFSTYLVDNRDQARVTDSTTTTSLGATRRPSKMRAMCKCQHARGDDPAPNQRAARLKEQLGDVVIEIAARSIAHRNHEPVELATRMKNQPPATCPAALIQPTTASQMLERLRSLLPQASYLFRIRLRSLSAHRNCFL